MLKDYGFFTENPPRKTLQTLNSILSLKTVNKKWASLRGLVHDNTHVWVLTVADCFYTHRKRVRCTQVNLQIQIHCWQRESISGRLV